MLLVITVITLVLDGAQVSRAILLVVLVGAMVVTATLIAGNTRAPVAPVTASSSA